MTAAAFAAVDWGTSSLRVWLMDAAGAMLGERRSGEGMLVAGQEGFSTILDRHLDALGAPPGLPVIACGMAGARQGWVEAPYVPVPATLEGLVAGAVAVPGQPRRVFILPGLAQRSEETPDVMRGEETQLAGVFPLYSSGRHLICLPGTHSKWVEAVDGTIVGFRTAMTGELFSVLSRQSILRHSVGDQPPAATPGNAAFRAACAVALEQGGDYGAGLFGIRAATLLHGLGAEDASARLSGLLVGAEIASARRAFAPADKRIILVASGPLGLLYRAALEMAGCTVLSADADDAVRAGLLDAAKRLNWI